ncbi:MAG: hypothetical protein AB8I52_11905, partial [Candidatus Promineifilaceae bacterium]
FIEISCVKTRGIRLWMVMDWLLIGTTDNPLLNESIVIKRYILFDITKNHVIFYKNELNSLQSIFSCISKESIYWPLCFSVARSQVVATGFVEGCVVLIGKKTSN